MPKSSQIHIQLVSPSLGAHPSHVYYPLQVQDIAVFAEEAQAAVRSSVSNTAALSIGPPFLHQVRESMA
jgi:hypothetical protein